MEKKRRTTGLLLAIIITGCSYRAEQKETAARPEPPVAMPGEQSAGAHAACSMVSVYFGTNRQQHPVTTPSGGVEPDEVFGDSGSTQLSYGSCVVSIPDSHDYGEVERPRMWKLEFREHPDRHVILQSVAPRPEEEVLQAIATDLEKSSRKQAFIFIHGYNVTFAAAARRTAQMAYDLKFDGPPIFFSWPSRGKLSGYVADLEEADGAARYLQQFLEQVATDTGALEIHVIAHSMGNRVLTEALDRMATASTHRKVARFNQILLAAPDIDAERFRNEIAPRISSRADRMTIYASSRDKALMASRSLHQSRRLGQGGDSLTTFPGIKNIDVVDASAVDFGFFELGHSAYGNELLLDIRETLNGVPAAKRPLQPHRSSLAWRVPELPPATEEKRTPVQTVANSREILGPGVSSKTKPAVEKPKRSILQRLKFWQ